MKGKIDMKKHRLSRNFVLGGVFVCPAIVNQCFPDFIIFL